MNRLKRSFEGGDADAYWRAKAALVESMLAAEEVPETGLGPT